jgi:CBS domain-containing protein
MENKEDATIFLEMVKVGLWETSSELKTGSVLSLNVDDRADTALRLLSSNDIMSCPVVDEFGRYYGMLDMMTIMSYSLDIFNQLFRPNRFSEEYLQQKKQFRSTSVAELLDRSSHGRASKQAFVQEDFSLFHALERMTVSGHHRLAIVDDNQYVTGIITQSALIQWLYTNMSKMSRDLRTTKALDIRPFNLVSTINVKNEAVNAFKLLKDTGHQSAAVVDDDGRLVDVVSTRDLRGISPESLTFRFLWNKIDFFKAQVRERYPTTPVRPISIHPTTTLDVILRAFVENGIHRLYIVSEMGNRRPLDVITMTDVLTFVLENIKGIF